MIVTITTTALMLAMSLLVTGPAVVAVKVFAQDTIVQDSDQRTTQSNSGQINQAGDGDGDRSASIDLENNAVNLDKQVFIDENNDDDDDTILQLSTQETEQSNAALIDQVGDGDGDRSASIDLENNALNAHDQCVVKLLELGLEIQDAINACVTIELLEP